MKFTVIALILICIVQVGHSQTIRGTVKNNDDMPIEYAVVSAYSLPDTTYINSTLTNAEGFFELKGAENIQHILHVSSFGYKTISVPAKQEQIIRLEDDVIVMEGVVIKGNRPISTVTKDGVQTIIEKTALSELGTSNEVLKRLPMVKGDNGQFAVIGRGAAKIYIDNREIRDHSEIDNLSPQNIHSIEVISDPGAKYGVTVASVIHIKTIIAVR